MHITRDKNSSRRLLKNNKIMNKHIITQQGHKNITITELSDGMVIIRRVWNPHSQSTKTTMMTLHKETFVSMFDAMADAVEDSQRT